MSQVLYAFWEYDLFPGCLGGLVEEFRGESVRIKGYGGHCFRPFKIIEGDQGQALACQLRELSAQYEDACAQLRKEYCEKRDQLIKLPTT